MTPEQQEQVLKNLPLVSINLKQILGSMSKAPSFLEWDDLEQAGREGLIRAVLEAPTKPDNVRWTTFAHWYIRQAIRDALEGSANKAGERQVRLPHRIHVLLNAMARASDVLMQSLEREPYPEELASHLGWEIEIIRRLQGWGSQSPKSYDTLGEDDDGNTAADLGQNIFASQEENIIDPIVMSTLEEVLASPMLLERENEVLIRNVVGDESLTDIGRDFGVTRERIRQIRQRALKKIRSDSRMRRQEDENLFVSNIRTAHLYRFANQSRSDDEWWAENTIKLEWTEERIRTWKYGSIPRSLMA